MIVTDMNITNIARTVITTNDIAGYTNCNTYQWGVSAGNVYGFTKLKMATKFSHSEVSCSIFLFIIIFIQLKLLPVYLMSWWSLLIAVLFS